MRYQLMVVAMAAALLGAGCQRGGRADIFPYPSVGSVAHFQEYPRWGISGTVRVVDERTVRIDDFHFNGGELRARIELLRDTTSVAILQDITAQPFDGATLTFTLPDNVTLQDFNLVSIFSPDLGVPVSGAKFP